MSKDQNEGPRYFCAVCKVAHPISEACYGLRRGPPSENLAPELKETPAALDVQEGGSHYKTLAIEPVEYAHANQLGFCEGSVIKYVTRWKNKNGLEDLKKARHFLDILIELETKNKA